MRYFRKEDKIRTNYARKPQKKVPPLVVGLMIERERGGGKAGPLRKNNFF